MTTRLLTALVALPVLIASIVLPYFLPQHSAANWLFLAIAALGLGAGLFEFFSMTKKLELKADAAIAYLGAAAFFVAFVFDAPRDAADLLIFTFAGFLIAVFISQMFRFQADFSKMLTGIGVTIAGVFYVAFLGGFVVAMRTGFENTLVAHLSTKLLGFFSSSRSARMSARISSAKISANASCFRKFRREKPGKAQSADS